jgi:ABC-2 type transport system ATP-binding protein
VAASIKHYVSVSILVAGLEKTFTSGRGAKKTTTKAVNDIAFSIDSGERVAYIGPNGAGKSTSIKILTGILHPSGGTATVLGIVPWQDRRKLAANIGTLFGQRSALWSELSPRQSYRMLAAIYGLDTPTERARVGELSELLGSADLLDQPVRTLSLGQRMRCELAACMLHEPAILFLDEPTIGLDLLAKQLFRELLVRVNEERNTTIFLTSHDVADIEHVARRAIVINHGSVIYDDAVAAMRTSLLSSKVIEVALTSPIRPELPTGAVVIAHTDTSMKINVDTSATSVRSVLDVLLEGREVSDITVVDPPLEQVIAEIYESPKR